MGCGQAGRHAGQEGSGPWIGGEAGLGFGPIQGHAVSLALCLLFNRCSAKEHIGETGAPSTVRT